VEWKNIIEEHVPGVPEHLLNLDPEIIEKAEEFYSKANWTGLRGQTRFMPSEPDTVEVDEQVILLPASLIMMRFIFGLAISFMRLWRASSVTLPFEANLLRYGPVWN
jgi:hypothetical protein